MQPYLLPNTDNGLSGIGFRFRLLTVLSRLH